MSELAFHDVVLHLQLPRIRGVLPLAPTAHAEMGAGGSHPLGTRLDDLEQSCLGERTAVVDGGHRYGLVRESSLDEKRLAVVTLDGIAPVGHVMGTDLVGAHSFSSNT